MNDLQAVDQIRAFFDEQLPGVIRGRGELFQASQGRVSIQVQEVGAWTIRFGDAAADDAITNELELDADLVLVFSPASFANILSGSVQNQQERPVVLGDLKLLERLGSLMLPTARGGIGARLWGS